MDEASRRNGMSAKSGKFSEIHSFHSKLAAPAAVHAAARSMDRSADA